MIRISLPAGAPVWVMSISLVGVLLIGLVFGLARLTRAALPTTPAERLDWWKCYWQHRRNLRRDRWQQHERRHASLDPARPAELSRLQPGGPKENTVVRSSRESNGPPNN